MDKTLELAKKGNKRALKKLYKSYSNYFYGYISKLVHSEAVTRDIFETTWQTVFLDITSINSMTVALFRTLNKVMENEKTRLGISQNKISLINNQSIIIDLHLNNKLLQLSDSDLEFLLDQILKSKDELTFQDDNNDIQIKTNTILSELMIFSDDRFQDITKLHEHLETMFNYHDIDKLMTYEIYTFIDNKQKRTKILYAGLLVIVSIIMIFLGRELSVREIETSNEIQIPNESEPTETQSITGISNQTEVILIGSLLNGGIVELDFQLTNAESSVLEHTDLFIRFPRLTNNSYKLKKTNDIYTLFYDLDYEKILDENILVEVSVSSVGVILIKEEFFIDLSLLEGWTKVYPINKTIETPLSQLEIIDLTLKGPFLSLNMKEIQSSMQSYHSYYVIVEDNNGNQYEGMDDYIYRDTFSINFGNLPQYSTIDTFEIYLESMFFEDLTYIGRIIEDQKSFMYNNHEFTFKVNRNTSGRVYFELFTDDVLFSNDYPNLLLKESDGWYRLHQNLFPFDVNITRLDYETVYNRTGGHVSVEEMLMYYLTTYNILLAEGDLSYQLQFLPEREFITVLVSDYKNDFLTYPTYFGDTLNDLELAIDAEFRVIEINEHFTVKSIE